MRLAGTRISALEKVVGFPRKAGIHLALLRRDPESFGRNLLQLTNPELFEERLIDIMNAVPMHVRIDPALGARPNLNILNSALTPEGMTGGPNTIINLGFRLAGLGVPVRLVTTVRTCTLDPAWFRRHAAQLVGDGELPEVAIETAAEPGRPLPVGPNDMFMTTHWTTVQQFKPVLSRLPIKQFFYMLQDFEPGFYAWSSNYALALETYGFDFWPIINESLLADYLFAQSLGRFADPDTRERAIVFEPAIEERVFHPRLAAPEPRPKRLLFYARPTNTRNMLGLGLTALRLVAADPSFAGWEFRAIGSRGSLPDLRLGSGGLLRPMPWMGYTDYARSLRDADVLLCPMLSPHTSYPVLEMAASGGLAVTNTFANKTEAALGRISNNIVVSAPTVEGFAAALLQAAAAVNRGRQRAAALNMPREWSAALDPVATRMAEIFRTTTRGRLLAADEISGIGAGISATNGTGLHQDGISGSGAVRP